RSGGAGKLSGLLCGSELSHASRSSARASGRVLVGRDDFSRASLRAFAVAGVHRHRRLRRAIVSSERPQSTRPATLASGLAAIHTGHPKHSSGGRMQYANQSATKEPTGDSFASSKLMADNLAALQQAATLLERLDDARFEQPNSLLGLSSV